MTLPYPEVVRGWITDSYSPSDLRAAASSHPLQEAIAGIVCAEHGITSFDDKLNVLYHVEDLIQEMES